MNCAKKNFPYAIKNFAPKKFVNWRHCLYYAEAPVQVTRMRLHRTAVITTQRGRFNENRNTFDWLIEIATPLVLGIINTSCIIAII